MIRTKRTPHAKLISGINITPFTDVCLVLLIIFMVTATALTKETSVNLNLPRAEHIDSPLPVSLTVRIGSDQQIFLNNQPTTFDHLEKKIQQHYATHGTRLLVVKADENVPYHLVIATIDIARKVGIDQIALATRQPDTVKPTL